LNSLARLFPNKKLTSSYRTYRTLALQDRIALKRAAIYTLLLELLKRAVMYTLLLELLISTLQKLNREAVTSMPIVQVI